MSLGNVLAVAYSTQKDKLTFLEEKDKVSQNAYSEPLQSRRLEMAASVVRGFFF